MSLFEELKRRNVVRVGAAYCVIGWILAQVAEFAFENFGAPEWVLKTFVMLLLLGLPLALFFSWAYEITPEGVKREKDVDRSNSITRSTGRKLDFVVIGALVLALGYFIWERQSGDAPIDGPAPTAVAEVETDISQPRSIAVLPFINMSSDQEQEWFSDGLTEEILNALARTPDLLVAARTSSFKFKNSGEDIPTIAKSLGVAHILEGSVRRDDARLRVTAQLIRASDGFHLWSQTYDRNPEDVIAIQENVAIEIATALETAMDPEALAKMISAGTSSVPAFNEYLKGLSFGATTFSTGDVYEFLSARDAFERAIELDPKFALAHWELANFWEVQRRGSNIAAGKVEIPRDEMLLHFDTAIENAIAFEQDSVSAQRYRIVRDVEYLRFDRALSLNTEYLEQRPNDTSAQRVQIGLLVDLAKDEELLDTIVRIQEFNGYDIGLASDSMTFSLISGDAAMIRTIANGALERMPDNPFVRYQAHRALLWSRDVDEASRLVHSLQSSDLPNDSKRIILLRQACAENRLQDAIGIYESIKKDFAGNISILWLSHMIMNNKEDATEFMMRLDQNEDLSFLFDFVSYAHFDARPFPNLMMLIESLGVEPRAPLELPYRCNR